ncbi:MAG: hypothetical protein AB7S78_13215 [Candidatus Omnitrophota bacterium]
MSEIKNTQETKKKGLIARFMEKLDKKLEGKMNQSPCCGGHDHKHDHGHDDHGHDHKKGKSCC